MLFGSPSSVGSFALPQSGAELSGIVNEVAVTH